MIHLYARDEIEKIRLSCLVVHRILKKAKGLIAPGVVTRDINARIAEWLREADAAPAFLGYRGYPAESCVSVNEEVVHGIPGRRKLAEGDIVAIDVGVLKDGFFGDAAMTYRVGNVSKEKSRLMDVTERALASGIRAARAGNRVADISAAIEDTVTSEGCMPVRDLVGHGIGRRLHEDPQVPNFRSNEAGGVLRDGMVLAIEPMINAGGYEVKTLTDGWTVVTLDGKPSAHFEHTVAIINGAAEILTIE
ncbi:MAG: type I methionyl aminopeptidase [Fibrobacterota bacterium]